MCRLWRIHIDVEVQIPHSLLKYHVFTPAPPTMMAGTSDETRAHEDKPSFSSEGLNLTTPPHTLQTCDWQ